MPTALKDPGAGGADPPDVERGGSNAGDLKPSVPARQNDPVASPIELAGVRIIVYRTDDPGCPAPRRFVGHWFDRRGELQVATAVGPSEEYCRERLAAFLSVEIVKASVAELDATAAARNRARTEKARAARAAKRAGGAT